MDGAGRAAGHGRRLAGPAHPGRRCSPTWPWPTAPRSWWAEPTPSPARRSRSVGRPRRGPMRSAGTSSGSTRAGTAGPSSSSAARSGRWASSATRGLRCGPRFCRRLGLADPGISWLTSRDRLVEQAFVLALVTGTLARIGNEVMELQRAEIGELAEGSRRRGRGQHHDAAQAQPGAQRAPGHPGPSGPGAGRRHARGAWSRSTSATGGAGRRSGRPFPSSAC